MVANIKNSFSTIKNSFPTIKNKNRITFAGGAANRPPLRITFPPLRITLVNNKDNFGIVKNNLSTINFSWPLSQGKLFYSYS